MAKRVKGGADSAARKDYIFSMSHAPEINQSTHWFQMLVISFFTAVIIMITRAAFYDRPMGQFFWSGGKTDLIDFFSYYKMGAILFCAALVVVLILYRIFVQGFFIKRSYAYIPMIIYSVFVLLSYAFSDYKLFALWGWNERFEGTLTLLAYMIMLFFIINSVNSEKNVKWIIYPLAFTSALLGLLGLTQALGRDFFRTTLGKKLITPSWFWDQLDTLNFTFQNNEIYQTVYNINYVSFYLTLLIPLFGLLFIRSMMAGKGEPVWRKALWGALFTLLIFNLIGSASSSGLMGMAVVVLVAIIVLNKRIIAWWKPVAILIVLTVIVAGISYSRWLPELTGAVGGVLGSQTQEQAAGDAAAETKTRHKVDYMETSGNDIVVSFDGSELTFITFPDDPLSLEVRDASGKNLSLEPTNVTPIYRVSDERFKLITVRATEDDNKNNFIVLGTDGREWPFRISNEGVKYFTGTGKLIDLRKVPAYGWEDNLAFGSGRGYIWSRTLPMLKDTLAIGRGADTYTIYFPHEDYVGKYNSVSFTDNINVIIDKPHNMYLGMAVGTGGISLLALLLLWGVYVVQSFFLYQKDRYDNFTAYAGAGIFLGICGFLVAGLVNDSTVSVMPMFYGLLGTGIAINMMLSKASDIKHT